MVLVDASDTRLRSPVVDAGFTVLARDALGLQAADEGPPQIVQAPLCRLLTKLFRHDLFDPSLD